MVARIVLLALLVLLVAAPPPPAGARESAPDPLALVESAPPAPLADDDVGADAFLAGMSAATTPPDPGAPRARFSDEAVPPGPPLARVFRPPRSPRA
jgi:hypothetical protein